jgi:hypothetical protein
MGPTLYVSMLSDGLTNTTEKNNNHLAMWSTINCSVAFTIMNLISNHVLGVNSWGTDKLTSGAGDSKMSKRRALYIYISNEECKHDFAHLQLSPWVHKLSMFYHR